MKGLINPFPLRRKVMSLMASHALVQPSMRKLRTRETPSSQLSLLILGLSDAMCAGLWGTLLTATLGQSTGPGASRWHDWGHQVERQERKHCVFLKVQILTSMCVFKFSLWEKRRIALKKLWLG